MCTYCGQHCVEDEPGRVSAEELKSGTRVPENVCPYKEGGGSHVIGDYIYYRTGVKERLKKTEVK